MDKETKKLIEEKLATYRQGEQQLLANLQATRGAIQGLEELLKEKEKKDDTSKGCAALTDHK